MPQTPFLSVCIPTYNRPAKLRRLLEALLPQLTPVCELVILDNCSEPSIETAIRDLVADFSVCSVKIIRNAVNVGANANILRCFEMAQGEWIWVTGDDDLPVDHGVDRLIEEAKANPETLFINFSSTILDARGVAREKDLRAEGIAGLIEQMDCFSNLLFISAGIYRRKGVIENLHKAYPFIDTCGPHLALLFIALIKNQGTILLSHHHTVVWEHTQSEDRWNASIVYGKLQRLLSLVPSARLRQIWFSKVSRDCPPPQRTYASLFKYLISKKGNMESIRDQLELASYLASMVPSYRWRAAGIWLVAHATSILWFPFYLVWSMVPASHPGSLANYGQEADSIHRFLNDNRI